MRKNSIFKNTVVAYRQMFKRYPASVFVLIFHIAARICLPMTNTFIPAVAIKGITSGSLKTFILLILGVLLAVMVLNIINGLTNAYMLDYRIYTRLGHFSLKFFDKCLNTDYQNIEPEPKRKIMYKAGDAVSGNNIGIENLMSKSMELVILIFGMFTYGTAVFILDWKIMLITVAMFVADTLCREWAIRYSDKIRSGRSVAYRKINYMKNSIKNVSAGKDIRIFQLEDWFHKRFDYYIKKVEKYQAGVSLHWFFPTIADCIFMLPRDILAYSIIVAKVISGQMDVATGTLYLGLVSGFANWIYGLSTNIHDVRRASHEFNDYNDFQELEDRTKGLAATSGGPEQKPGVPEPVEGPPEIEFRNVSFSYEGSDKKIFENLSFKIRAGEKIALVGNNGAGKTTIVKLLCGLYAPTGGEVYVNGKLLWDGTMDIQKYMDTISVLFQDTNPFAISIAMNVASCSEEDLDRNKVRECLKKAGLLEKVDSLPHKEDSYITQQLEDDGIQLSGGEVQKLLLAKAIYKDGSFLILDEPTSALDPLAESKIYEEYNSFANNKTALFISHRLASTKFCDRILFLDGGKILEEGTHAQLMDKGGKYKEIFDIQSHYYKESNQEGPSTGSGTAGTKEASDEK